MKRYAFFTNSLRFNGTNYEIVERVKKINYKCPICDYMREWDETYDDEKKSQIKTEVEIHYNEHIVPNDDPQP